MFSEMPNAGIEYPFGRTVGNCGDSVGQLAVVRAIFKALVEIDTPGDVRHLPFEWPEPPKRTRTAPPQPPPIAQYLRTHPWQLPNLLSRNVPH